MYVRLGEMVVVTVHQLRLMLNNLLNKKLSKVNQAFTHIQQDINQNIEVCGGGEVCWY
jgi:hypothetical protein